jgi:hypothetical protein
MTEDDKALVEQLRDEADTWDEPKHADEIDMRGKLHTAADRIEAQAVEIEELRHDLERQMTIANEHVNEAEAHYDRGYYDGSTHLLEQHEDLREALVDLLHAVCGKTGFAEAVRRDSGRMYPWPCQDCRDKEAMADEIKQLRKELEQSK